MSWISNIWKSKNDTLWRLCEKCEQMEYMPDFEKNLRVCSHCDHHHKLSSSARMKMLFGDNYKIEQIKVPQIVNSKNQPVSFEFTDIKEYKNRAKDQANDDNFGESATLCMGYINNYQTAVVNMDFSYIGGSMGVHTGMVIEQACKISEQHNIPLVVITSSGGARIQEGIYALLQMPKTISCIKSLRKTGIPCINILCNPTMGGVFASFASQGSITIAEPCATIGFTGQRVLEKILPEKFPDNFQTSEFQYECGQIDQIVHRSKIKDTLTTIFSLLCR